MTVKKFAKETFQYDDVTIELIKAQKELLSGIKANMEAFREGEECIQELLNNIGGILR